MTSFIIIAFLILVATLFLLARPLLKTRNTISYERQAQNIHFAKERLQELEDQLKNASISATDYEALRLEIESNLASDIDLASNANKEHIITPRRTNKPLISILLVILPLLSAGLYWATGTPSALSSSTSATERPSAQEVNRMLEDIEQRLAANPSDAKGWAVLSRTYLALGRFREARDGFLKLIELEGESAQLLTSVADASGLMADGDMSGEPARYIERALALEPNNPQALWLAGVNAAQQNQGEKARGFWNKLLPLLAGTPQQQEELKVIIQQTFNGTSVANTTPSSPSQDAPSSSKDAANQTASQAVQNQLTISVSVAQDMQKNTRSDDLVFVFARAKNGPPAPLAVKRLTVADLPAKITLSDADAMMPQFKISLFDELIVSARIAKSGNPVAQTGDIQSKLLETKNSAKGELQLEINTIIE